MEINNETLRANGFYMYTHETYPNRNYWLNKNDDNHHIYMEQNEYDGSYTYKDNRNVMYGLKTIEDLNTIIGIASGKK